MKLKVELKREDCISCQACTISAPEDFKMSDEDGKATLISGTGDKIMTKEVEADDARKEQLEQAATGCPVDIISVTEVGSGETAAKETNAEE